MPKGKLYARKIKRKKVLSEFTILYSFVRDMVYSKQTELWGITTNPQILKFLVGRNAFLALY